MADQRLVDYLRNGLRKGYSADSLRQALLSKGYYPNEVNEAFSAAGGYEPGAIRPVAVPAPNAEQPPVSLNKKMKLRRVGVFSSAKVSTIIAVAMGVVIIIFSLILSAVLAAIFGSAITASGLAGTGGLDTGSLLMGLLLGGIVSSMLMIPIYLALLAAIGFISGALGAIIYNVVAGLVGGYEVEFE